MNPHIFLFLTISFFAIVADHRGYTITGYTSNIADSTLVFLDDFTDNVDSTYIVGNKFIFSGKMDKPHKLYLLYIYTDSGYIQHTKKVKNLLEDTFFWLENNDIVFDATNVPFTDANITGSGMQQQSDEYKHVIEYYQQKIDRINVIMEKMPRNDNPAFVNLRNKKEIYRKKKQNRTIQFIKEHPGYELSAYHLFYLKNTIVKEDTKKLYEGLNEKVKATEWGKSVELFLEKTVKLKSGDKAIDFVLADLKGNEVSLSSYRGKYVLLEFWLTGCAPCHQENPNLLKAYRTYKGNGFEILGVSLDKSRKSWKSTIEKDSILWTTVCDLKGMSGIIPMTYSVYYIPNNYLIDPEGIIIAKDLRGENLQEKLKELFEKSQ